MRVYLVLLQCICVSAIPLFRRSLRPVVEIAQGVFLSELNRRTSFPNLCHNTWTAVEQIAEVGFNTFDVDLNFGVRQTICNRGSEMYLDRCAILSNLMLKAMCTGRLRVSPGYAQLLALRCVTDSSSSESSSSEEEDLIRISAQNSVQGPGVLLCKGAVSCARLLW